MQKIPNNWTVFSDAQVLAEKLALEILELAEEAIKERGEFHLVTAGGTTPTQAYQILAEQDYANWDKWVIYLGDERVFPADNPERNSKVLQDEWLSKVAVKPENIKFMQTELGLEEAGKDYQTILQAVDLFDLVLLGMGEDGHTASLFPGHGTLEQDLAGIIYETNSPKAPLERLSLSKNRLEKTRCLIKLITGAGKKPAVEQWLAGEELPINQVNAENTKVYLSQDSLP